MSLNIYLRGVEIKHNLPIIADVEREFKKLKITGTPTERQLISSIDQGTWNDEYSFIDRFGFKLYTDYLSTGCKAGLCVINNPDKLVDLVECGLNARDAIIKTCKIGNILFDFDDVTIEGLGEEIDVVVEGNHFTTVRDLNRYLEERW